MGESCGVIADACGNTLDCGTCTAPLVCGPDHTCVPDGGAPTGCTPEDCIDVGIECGIAGDGCGNIINCGSCLAPEVCGGGGIPGQCAPSSCLCSNGTATWAEYPSTSGSCEEALVDCFGPAPDFDAGCQRSSPDGGRLAGPGDPCTDDGACTCDLVCGVQYGAGTCDYRCTTSADCPLPWTTCQSGVCLIDYCGPTTGNGALDGTCDAADAGDGTCEGPIGGTTLVQVGGQTLGVCFQASLTSSGSCSIYAQRDQPAELCALGSECVPNSLEGLGSCEQVCNPTLLDAGCPTGRRCDADLQLGAGFGYCGF